MKTLCFLLFVCVLRVTFALPDSEQTISCFQISLNLACFLAVLVKRIRSSHCSSSTLLCFLIFWYSHSSPHLTVVLNRSDWVVFLSFYYTVTTIHSVLLIDAEARLHLGALGAPPPLGPTNLGGPKRMTFSFNYKKSNFIILNYFKHEQVETDGI